MEQIMIQLGEIRSKAKILSIVGKEARDWGKNE